MIKTAPTAFPRRISKSELKELFTYSDTSHLQHVIFTADWLEVLGWDIAVYKSKRTFDINQTRQIYFMLKARKLI